MKQTSLEAYTQLTVDGKDVTLREKVLSYIIRHPGCTQVDISRDLGESSRKRVSELVADGSVYEAGKRQIGSLHYTTYRYAKDAQLTLF
jgi:chromosome segregation and condensation protein ScpB